MKIKRGDIYYIELYLEPGKISDHNKRSNGTLSFTGVELMLSLIHICLSGRTFFLLQEWRKMALLMEIRLQKNEKRNISSDYHVQYAANHLEKAKDVFMKAMKILWIYIAPVSYTHLDVYKRQQ